MKNFDNFFMNNLIKNNLLSVCNCKNILHDKFGIQYMNVTLSSRRDLIMNSAVGTNLETEYLVTAKLMGLHLYDVWYKYAHRNNIIVPQFGKNLGKQQHASVKKQKRCTRSACCR